MSYSKLTPDEFFSKCTHVLCSAEYRQLENDNAQELWDKEKSILLKKVAKLLDSRKRAGRVEEERLQPETTASAQPITQDLPAQHLHQVQLNQYETAPNFIQLLNQNLTWDCLLI